MRTIGADIEARLDWLELAGALEAGHLLPKPRISDVLFTRGEDAMLSRHAWVDGLGILVKTATVFPGNATRQLPSVNGAVTLFDDVTGQPRALIDFSLVTRWKTAADSLLGALHLARPDSRAITVIGAGVIAGMLIRAYAAAFPQARFTIWNRSPERARALAASLAGLAPIRLADDIESAVRDADIVTAATMSTTPLIRGAWLRPGQHVDLVGAFRPDMREADDEALSRARIFVDARATTIGEIGELVIPMKKGVISEKDVIADFHDIATGGFRRTSAEEITLFKNGGGAHLDLMTAAHIVRKAEAAQG